jgi:Flp pilus assembly protein TadG
MAINLASLIGRALRPRRRRGFARDERGVTAVEFGLLALPFFSIVGAILETSVVFLSGQILESAVHDVSRLIRTGQAQAANVTEAGFKQTICGRLYGLFADCEAELFVEVQVLNSFNATSITPPVDWSAEVDEDWTRPQVYSPGTGSSIVLVQVYYKWPVVLGLGDVSMANLPGGRRLLGTAAVFRNEPFS